MVPNTASSFVFLVLVAAATSNLNSLLTARSVVPASLGGLSSDLVEGIADGARIAAEECRRVFRWDRWNCPESTFVKKYHQSATKEQAYAQAVVAAGIVHAITRRCSSGKTRGCGCAASPRGRRGPVHLVSGSDILPDRANETVIGGQRVDWSWGGCSDDVGFGEAVAKSYLEHSDGPLSLTRVHNSVVGREIVRKTMEKRCRCHGLSGSCTVQTCWMQAAPFTTIVSALKQKYNAALRVDAIVDDISNSAAAEPASASPGGRRLHETSHLIFSETSPDYCVANVSVGWRGTRGRSCSRPKDPTADLAERRSCRNVCRSCGLRVRRTRRTSSKRCNCSFRWCCEVRCEVCEVTVEEFYCD